MRRLTQPERDDRGVVTLFVVGVVAILMIAAAFAIDVGRHVTESWSAQNSADATALAMAADCVRDGSLSDDYSEIYSDYRKTDQEIHGDPEDQPPSCGTDEVRVTVTKAVTDGLLLNRDARTVKRPAAAKWKRVGVTSVPTLPIAIADCEFSPEILDGEEDITLLLDNPQPETGCSSLPGGFSQLVSDDNCEATVENPAEGKPGNDLQNVIDCILPLPQDVLIPMYDAEACEADPDCKGQGPYSILGFAMFHITGYWFTNNTFSGGTLEDQGCPEPEPEPDAGPGPGPRPGPAPGPGPATGPQNCIAGDFIQFVSSPGPTTDPGSEWFGAFQVYLSS
jgi:hypothetical protein